MSHSYYQQFVKQIAEKDGKIINDKHFHYIIESFAKYSIEFKQNTYNISRIYINICLGENIMILIFPASNILITCSYNTAKCMSFIDAILEKHEFSYDTKIIEFQYFDVFLRRVLNSPKIIIVSVPLNAIIIGVKCHEDFVEETDPRYSPVTPQQQNYNNIYYDENKNIHFHKLLYFKG